MTAYNWGEYKTIYSSPQRHTWHFKTYSERQRLMQVDRESKKRNTKEKWNILAFFWPSALRVFQDGGNSLYSFSPRPQSAFQLPPSMLSSLPPLPLSLIHSLSQHPSPAVDLRPPPPNSTQLFSFWVIFIPPMFIHDRGSEREIRSQVLSWPRGLWGLQVSLHAHTQTYVHVNTFGEKKNNTYWNTQAHVCIHVHMKTHAC